MCFLQHYLHDIFLLRKCSFFHSSASICLVCYGLCISVLLQVSSAWEVLTSLTWGHREHTHCRLELYKLDFALFSPLLSFQAWKLTWLTFLTSSASSSTLLHFYLTDYTCGVRKHTHPLAHTHSHIEGKERLPSICRCFMLSWKLHLLMFRD